MADITAIVVDFVRQNISASLTLLVGFSVYSLVQYHRSPWRKVPPGPKGWPFIGNALDLGGSHLWLKFTEWRETYGDIIFLSAAGQPIIVLNSPKAVAELLDKRAGNTSDRPRNIVGFEMLTGGLFMALQPHSDVWRRMRRATHEGLSKSSATAYHPGQMTESASLALELLHYPSQWLSHVQRANASFTINFLYGSNAATDGNATLKMDGMTTTSEDTDSRIAEINEFAERLATSLLPGAHLVEFFPWMKYIPARFAKWKRVALESFKTDSAIFERMMAPAYASLTRGEEPSSLMGKISKDQDRYNLTSGERAWTAATMYTAGAETVSSVMAWWVQAMALYPEAQARAQSELDNFVGRARLPTFADYENLPYIRAMVKEILRWGLVAPFGLPHASTVDDYYKGYFIPANSLIIPNIWLLNRDPLVWGPDAMEFRPERHIYDGTELRVPAEAREEGHFTFGFGRRVCVGKHVGNNSLFMEVVTILWAMNIERPKNQDGLLVPIDSDGCVDTGLTVRPTSFDIKVTPRFPEAMTILEHEKDVLKR